MKIFILSFLFAFISTIGYTQVSLDSIIVEQIDASSVMEGATTYRVFVDLEPGYQLLEYWGNQDCALTYLTTDTWYNTEYGGSTNVGINSLFIPMFPELAFDSYLSLGGATGNEWAVLFDDDTDGEVDGRMVIDDATIPSVSTLGVDINDELNDNFGVSPSLNSFIEDSDGQFFTLTPHDEITPNNRIMIGQFTTAGDFSFAINLTTRLIGTSTFHSLSACEYPSLNYNMAVGIEDLSVNAGDLNIYPNPAQNELFLNFQLKESGPMSFEIFDIYGKTIKSLISTLTSGEVTHLLNTESLETGMYFIRISNEKNAVTKRFAILR